MERSIKNSEGMEAHILQLDSLERRTRTLSFRSNKEAEKKFLELEKENADKPHIQTVMASSSSIQALKRAYPSYYADTGNFVRFIGRLQSKHKEASK